MRFSRTLNIVCITVGAILGLYSQFTNNQLFLIFGISLILFGVYRTSRNIPSKHQEDNLSDETKDI